MITNLYLILFAVFAFGVLLGLLIMWLLLRPKLRAQERQQAETAQKFQDALLAKERLEAEVQRVPHLEADNQALQDEKVQLSAKSRLWRPPSRGGRSERKRRPGCPGPRKTCARPFKPWRPRR